jgi:chitinase
MTNMHGVLPLGFSSTTRAINDAAVDCNGKNTDNINARLGFYHDYCR